MRNKTGPREWYFLLKQVSLIIILLDQQSPIGLCLSNSTSQYLYIVLQSLQGKIQLEVDIHFLACLVICLHYFIKKIIHFPWSKALKLWSP